MLARLNIAAAIPALCLQPLCACQGCGTDCHKNSMCSIKLYYLSDGNPIKDHPYSGTFAFHIRGERHYIRPKAGMLMMWPHDLLHSVAPFYGETYRTVINFNIEV